MNFRRSLRRRAGQPSGVRACACSCFMGYGFADERRKREADNTPEYDRSRRAHLEMRCRSWVLCRWFISHRLAVATIPGRLDPRPHPGDRLVWIEAARAPAQAAL